MNEDEFVGFLTEQDEGTEDEPFQDSGSSYVPSDNESESDVDDPQINQTHVPKDDDNVTKNVTIPPRKRKRGDRRKFKDESVWKRNVRKKLRNSGEEYISARGKPVPKKCFDDSNCKCIRECHNLLSLEQRKKIFDTFYALGEHDLQTSYIYGLIKLVHTSRSTTSAVVSSRTYTRLYYLPNEHGLDVPVCKQFFKKCLCVSDGRLTRSLQNKRTGKAPFKDLRGKHEPHNKTSAIRTQAVVNFIEKFPKYQSHYSRNKNSKKCYLAPTLNLAIMYELYKTEVENPVSKYVFRDIFRTRFNLSFHAPLSDSCKTCDSLDQKINAEATGKLVMQYKAEKELHLRKAEAARSGMKKDGELGRDKKNDVTAIAFDLMRTLPTPHLSTGVCYYKRQLWTYCLGIHNLSTNNAHMYMWNESVASRGPQEIGSCLLHYMKNVVTTSKLIMYSDQCGGQNRNIKLAVLCNYIIDTNISSVRQIDHKFLVSGHSYMSCDQDFGVIEKHKKCYNDIYIPKDWTKVVRNARKRNPFTVVELSKEDFISTATLEKCITNRKKTDDHGTVSWLKMQWLRYIQNYPRDIYFKYSNNEEVLFERVDITKRNTNPYKADLDILYPEGRKIESAKYSNLQDLLPFIPPIHHNFYNLLQVTDGRGNVDGDDDIMALHSASELLSSVPEGVEELGSVADSCIPTNVTVAENKLVKGKRTKGQKCKGSGTPHTPSTSGSSSMTTEDLIVVGNKPVIERKDADRRSKAVRTLHNKKTSF